MSITIPFALASSIACRDMCDYWLSRIRRILRSFEQRVWRIRCPRQTRKQFLIYPTRLIGLSNATWRSTPGEMITEVLSGKYEHRWQDVPGCIDEVDHCNQGALSADVADPPCFFPLSVTMSLGIWTVAQPVPSRLWMSSGLNWFVSITWARLS